MDIGISRARYLEKKLTAKEFIKHIPNLELSELYEIEIKINDEWQHLFDPRLMMGLYCNLCDIEMTTNDLKHHFQLDNHLKALKKVEQFYHPLFTASKDDEDLENNEFQATKKRHDTGPIMNYNQFEKQSHKNNDYDVIVSTEDFLEIEFINREHDEWKKMLRVDGPISDKGKYHCRLCNKPCVGVITLNAHLRGNSHHIMQKSAFALRCLKNKQVTKFTTISIQNIEALIGVEYVLKLENANRYGDCMFACCLCNFIVISNQELMENHIIGYSHRLKYCELHYADTITHFQRMISSSTLKSKTLVKLKYSDAMSYVLSRMAYGIEEYHSYGKPTVLNYDDFMKDKEKVGDEVFGLPHACQEFGPSFSNVVTISDLINLTIDGDKSWQTLKETPKPRFIVQPTGKYYLNMSSHISRSKKNSDNKSIKEHHTPDVREKKPYSKSRSISPPNSRKRKLSDSRHIKMEPDVWNTYRQLISKAAAELEKIYKDIYCKNPERHPSYDKEWSAFWKRRKTELKEAGKNYHSYDYQPEWTIYFRQRLKELFNEDIEKSKIDVRCQLNIPLDAEEDSRVISDTVHKLQQLSNDPRERESKNLKGSSVSIKREPSINPIKREPSKSLKKEKPKIIHVLRLMTALEEHLGSVGSQILDLLTLALSLEKNHADDLDQLEQKILNSDNCKILKIAKEKLKSQLYADLVETRKVNSFNRVIEDTETLLNRADEMGWSTETTSLSFEEPNSINLPTNDEIENLLGILRAKSQNDILIPNKSSPTVITHMEYAPEKEVNTFINTFGESLQSNQNCQDIKIFQDTSTYVGDLTKQNTSFSQQNTTSIENSNAFPLNGASFNSVCTNFNIDTASKQRNIADFLDRLDGHPSVRKRNRQQ